MQSVCFLLYINLGASPPTEVTAVQDGPTSIRVTWTPPSPLGDTTGYKISFTGGGNSDSVDVSGGDSMSHTLTTGLTNGVTYTISITAISPTSLPSAPVHATVGLGRSTHVACIALFRPIENWYMLIKLCNSIRFTSTPTHSVPQFHQLQSSVHLQQSQPLPSPSLVVFPLPQW